MRDISERQRAIIHEWTREQVESASKPNYGKVYVTAPNLLSLLGDVEGKRVLELGCGNGYWLRLLARAGAECVGIDHAENQIAAAKEWQDDYTSSIRYEVGDVSTLQDAIGSFDLVFFEHVLLEIPSKEQLESAMRTAYDALKPGCSLIVSDLHPFAPSSRPDNLRVANDFNYFNSGAQIEIASKRLDGEVIYYKDCHWTLSDIVGAITKHNFSITEIREPLPDTSDVNEHPEELSYRLSTPMAIMIKALKPIV